MSFQITSIFIKYSGPQVQKTLDKAKTNKTSFWAAPIRGHHSSVIHMINVGTGFTPDALVGSSASKKHNNKSLDSICFVALNTSLCPLLWLAIALTSYVQKQLVSPPRWGGSVGSVDPTSV